MIERYEYLLTSVELHGSLERRKVYAVGGSIGRKNMAAIKS